MSQDAFDNGFRYGIKDSAGDHDVDPDEVLRYVKRNYAVAISDMDSYEEGARFAGKISDRMLPVALAINLDRNSYAQ